jgi:transcriptional regulator with GAF, ATPase, and Fis domain
MEKILLSPEVCEKAFSSALYKQVINLLQQIFKRNFGFSEIVGVTQENYLKMFGHPEIPIRFLKFCQLIYNTEEGRKRCLKGEQEALNRMTSNGQIDITNCHAGLTEVGVPILVKGKYCGCITPAGGLLLHEPNSAEFETITKYLEGINIDLAELRKAYFEITPVSKELFDVMLKLLNEAIEQIINNAIEFEETHKKISELETALIEKYRFGNIIGQSKPILDVFHLLEQIKDGENPVLIQGESGTGKELIARAIHYNSSRKDKPFLAQNCAVFSESLLESELFGHAKGAFTGAIKDHRGLFEVADGGTVLLDEIAEMSPNVQAKLLRVLDSGEIKRVGGENTLKVNVRVISATNKDLRELIKKGDFRDDLYYRLKGISINLPPLRERKEDIPLLVKYFLDINNQKAGKKVSIDTESLKLLCDYDWPGNIRELENEVKRLITMTKDIITADILSKEIKKSLQEKKSGVLNSQFIGKTLHDIEKELIFTALKTTNWNKTEAAKILGIPRTSLNDKISNYGLSK